MRNRPFQIPAHSPLLSFAQRLPSVFQFRETAYPVDRAYPSAFVVSDAGGYYFRTLGHRFDLPSGTRLVILATLMAIVLILRPSGLTGGRELALPRRRRS